MQANKASPSQVRKHNRQLVLRAVYTKLANSRADLAQATGLTKPTISDLVAELLDEGFLVEGDFGPSTFSGGKRPRLLEFIPEARQVIGVSITPSRIDGMLMNLDGRVIAEHAAEIPADAINEALDILSEVINGLVAQMSAPLLCIGVGVSALVDTAQGVIRYDPRLGWRDLPLVDVLETRHRVPVYLANNTELAALAQMAFGQVRGINSLATILVGNSIGVGVVLGDNHYMNGSEIGDLIPSPHATTTLEAQLGWTHVNTRAQELGITADRLSYLNIRYEAANHNPAALQLQDELAASLSGIVAWIIALMRPEYISLAGDIADLGDDFLAQIVHKTQSWLYPNLVESTRFFIDDTPNLPSLGAAARALRSEIGLV